MQKINNIKFSNFVKALLFLVIVFSIFVRFQGLGYSNFQGDEVNPMDFLYEMKDGILPYLMSQKRGPVQYLVNMINVGVFGYHGEWQIRFPFFVFGTLALYTLFKLARRIFGDTSAFITVVFIAVNGLFIAFARITQYQSFMYFLIPVGVLLFIRALEKSDRKRLLYSGLIMSLAFLAHYDTLSVIPFFIAALIGHYYRDAKGVLKNFFEKKRFVELIKHALTFFGAFFIPALAYYIPFYLNSSFEDSTSGYLTNRLFGGGFMPRTEITLKLITMYIPKFHIYILFVFAILAILFLSSKVGGFTPINLKKIIPDKLLQKVFVISAVLIPAVSMFSLYPVKPRASTFFVILLSLCICIALIFSRRVDKYQAAVATWFLSAFSFYFFIMKDPRTHVYVVFIPLFILAGYGFSKLYNSFKTDNLKNILLVAFIAMLFFVSGVNYVIFVNKSPEYPWWDKDFLGWHVYKIQRVRHKKIEGVFGFNNYRGWEQIKDLYDKGCLVGDFNSNEKNSITYFYTRMDQKKGNLWELVKDSDNLILIHGPHSWEYTNIEERPDGYNLLKIIYSENYPVSYIYGRNTLYPEGKLLCEN